MIQTENKYIGHFCQSPSQATHKSIINSATSCNWAYENYSFCFCAHCWNIYGNISCYQSVLFCQSMIKSSKNSRWKSLIIQTPYLCVRLCWFLRFFLSFCCFRTYSCKTRWCMSIFISHYELRMMAGDGNLLVTRNCWLEKSGSLA